MATEKEHKTRKLYHAQTGMILLELDDFEFDKYLIESKYVELNDEYYELMYSYNEKIAEVLKKCPDVKNVRWLGELRKEHYEPFHNYQDNDKHVYVQRASSFLHFECFLPKSERRFPLEVRYEKNVIEHFSVLYNGQMFFAYAEVSDDVSSFMFGPEVREFFEKILKCSEWSPTGIPPCPLHPNIQIAITSEEEGPVEIIKTSQYEIKIKLPHYTEKDLIEYLEYFCSDCFFNIEYFLSTSTIEQALSYVSLSIEESFNNLTELFEIFVGVSSLNIYKKINSLKKIRESLFSLRLSINEYHSLLFKLQRNTNYLSNKSRYGENDSFFYEYFSNYSESEPTSLLEIKNTIDYMDGVVSNNYLNFYTLIAAICGGILGAIISNIPKIWTSILSIVSIFCKQ
jgi:hypothetical protein